MSKELKQCPFCGSDDLSVKLDDGFSYYVWCGDCGSQTDNDNLTEEDAISRWNNRPIEDAKNKEIERLKAKLWKINDLTFMPEDVRKVVDMVYKISSLFGKDTDVLTNDPDTNVGTKEVDNGN